MMPRFLKESKQVSENHLVDLAGKETRQKPKEKQMGPVPRTVQRHLLFGRSSSSACIPKSYLKGKHPLPRREYPSHTPQDTADCSVGWPCHPE